MSFDEPKLEADLCRFALQINLPKFNLRFPSIPFPPPFLPFPFFKLALSCDLSKPIAVAAGIAFGGGRIVCADPDPDEDFES